MGSKKYYKDLDFIRLLACIAVLLYHLNILKGGYLAVCTFFVLSGYLSCISMFKKEKLSLLSYYYNRLLKIYLPLTIVVFITIAVCSLFPNINWFNLKPETTSVLLGYNNFWQLGANADYFARHINSPFIHLWYIAILLQFELVFPFIYYILRKIGDKMNKFIPCIIITLISIIFTIYFYKMSITQDIMITYYNTFTRTFSLLFGVAIGFIHSYYGVLIPKVMKGRYIHKIIFYTYILILILLFIFIDAKSIYFSVSIILSTLITCRLIDYGTVTLKDNLSICDKFIKSLASISYETYLIQYPIIFLFQYINISKVNYMIIIFIIIVGLSYALHLLFYNKNYKLKCCLALIFIPISLFGVYKYVLAEDYTIEMKQLEKQLVVNAQLIQKKQAEYEQRLEQEKQDLMVILKELENAELELKGVVTNMSITGIGDSVMLGAVKNLYKKFPNGYFDAQISRTAWVANGILQNLKNRNMLGDAVILNLGANGDCSYSCKMKIMETCGNRDIFWINVTNDNDVHVNEELVSLSSQYDNLHIIDWNAKSKGHNEYFLSDGIHLTKVGREAYTDTIYNFIYETYLEEYKNKKEDIINQHEEKLKTKISFYGNDILLNAFDYIENSFIDSKFAINKGFTYEILEDEISKSIKNESLNYKIVFAFDNNINLSKEEYQKIIELCNGHKIYILATSEQSITNLYNIDYENVIVINFYDEIKSNKEYLMPDGIHLTKEGNIALTKIFTRELNSINY